MNLTKEPKLFGTDAVLIKEKKKQLVGKPKVALKDF